MSIAAPEELIPSNISKHPGIPSGVFYYTYLEVSLRKVAEMLMLVTNFYTFSNYQ
jgi:hypothetical protein